jgi:hypothetical protein
LHNLFYNLLIINYSVGITFQFNLFIVQLNLTLKLNLNRQDAVFQLMYLDFIDLCKSEFTFGHKSIKVFRKNKTHLNASNLINV